MPAPKTLRLCSVFPPLSGFKAQLLEGGIRVPFLAQWKARLPAGKVYDQPVISLDIVPTALAAAEVKVPEGTALDGVSLLPQLTGETDRPPHEILLWRQGASFAARKGSWKLLRSAQEPARLFDLAADSAEKNDLASEKPDLVKEIEAAIEKWNSELAKPLWGGQAAAKKAKTEAKAKAKTGDPDKSK